jgi:hypothetical protein
MTAPNKDFLKLRGSIKVGPGDPVEDVRRAREQMGTLSPHPHPLSRSPEHALPGRGAPPPAQDTAKRKQVSPSPGEGVLGGPGEGAGG